MPTSSKTQQIRISSQLKNIRSRIIKIIDEKIYLFQSTMKKKQSFTINKRQTKVIINQSKLEEWVQFFYNQILLAQNQQQHTINVKLISKYTQSQSKLNTITFKKPHQSSIDSNKILYCKQNDNIFKIFTQTDQIQKVPNKLHDNNNKHKLSFQQQSYQLTHDSIKNNCSIDYVHKQNRIILIGGCKPNNHNIKSSKIYSFHIKSGQIELIAKLPYGISSHGTVYDQRNKQIYIVGGNKNHSVVTRGCFKFNIDSNVLQQISCLNYPASSMNCILWKQKWVYKFGGIGESFQNWNTSPYIERYILFQNKVINTINEGTLTNNSRYSIQQNEWEVINPVINAEGRLSSQRLNFCELFFVNGFSYVCEDEKQIFIFGGYSISGEMNECGVVLEICQNQEQNQPHHVIKQFGKLVFYSYYQPDNSQKRNEINTKNLNKEQHREKQMDKRTLKNNNWELHANRFAFVKNVKNQVQMYGLKIEQHNYQTQQANIDQEKGEQRTLSHSPILVQNFY